MTPLRRTTLFAAAALAAAGPAAPPLLAQAPAGPAGPRNAGPVTPAATFDSSDPKRFIYHQWMTLGRRAVDRGRIADAREYYGYAMDLAYRFVPQEHFPFEELGDLLRDGGQLPEAAHSYLEAIAILRSQDLASNGEIIARIERKLGLLPESARRAAKPLVTRKPQAEPVFALRPPDDDEDGTGEVVRPRMREGVPEPRIERPSRVEPRPRPGGPLVDFDHMELNLFAGGCGFSDDFFSDPSGCGGAFLRAPAPGLPVLKNLGVFAEVMATSMDRDITPPPSTTRGTVLLLGGGADYTFMRDEEFMLMGQGGLVFADFGGITDLGNGFGVLVGALGGINVDKGVWMTYNPQIAAAGSSEWIIFHNFGVHIEF
jgi:hypothetical protein